jgi:VIT1/CCC1 family predicted Fe2+/Mn2+ transporter
MDEDEVEAHGHQHRDVSGGRLRPTVFGAMDGLVSNASLVAGVAGAGVSRTFVVLTGLAGLVAGACSMAAGEYISVQSQNELIESEVENERRELARNPAGETAELAALYEARGLSPELAAEVAEVISRDPATALGVHAREELHVDPEALPSPWAAAGLSFVSFVLGAVVPLAPYLLGFSSIAAALVLSAFALILGGGVVGRMTGRPIALAAGRQLLVGALSAGATYAIGALIGVDAS